MVPSSPPWHEGFRTLYLRSAPPLLSLALLEQLLFHRSYAAPFLRTATERAVFLLQGLALALVLALPFALSAQAMRWLVRRLERWAPTRTTTPTLAVMATVLTLLGATVLSSTGGIVFRPAPALHYGLLLVAVVLYTANLRVTRRFLATGDAARLNALTIAELVFCTWILFQYRDLFLGGSFGFEDHVQGLRTLIVLGVPFVTACAAPWLVAIRRLRNTRARRAAGACLLGIAVTLMWVDGTYYVDNYLELHAWLSVVTIACAWLAWDLLNRDRPTFGGPGPASSKRGMPALAAWALIAGAVLCLSLTERSRLVRQVGAIHTVFQRLALELLHAPSKDIIPRVTRIAAYYAKSARQTGDVGTIPTTFQSVQPIPGLGVPRLEGVVLFILDRKRPRDLGPYQASPSATPGIDACFRDAFVFDRAYSAGSNTLGAYPTIYTGTYAATRYQGRPRFRRRFDWNAYAEGHNLQTTFRRGGFRTTAFVHDWYWGAQFGAPDLEPVYGGFERVVRQHADIPDLMDAITAAYRETPTVIPSDGRFLTVFQLFPHGNDAASLAGIDAFVATVCDDLRARGRWDDTLLLLTADHGFQYREHGRTDYGLTVFNEEIQVPLLVRVPGLHGKRVSEPVSSTDHFATLIEMLRLDARFALEGRSYAPTFFGHPLPDGRPIFSETVERLNTVAVIRDDLKLIWWKRTGATALFDLSRDPGERHSLVDDAGYQAAYDDISGELSRFLHERGEP